MPEMLDIYDINMTRIGVKERSLVHRDGDWHKTFHCWIVYRDANGSDKLVVQRRGPDKDLYPNLFDITAAGHYEAGETIEDGIREIKEELGIDVAYADLMPLGVAISLAKVGDLTNLEFSDVFFLNYNADIATYHFDRDEVAGLAVFDVDQGLEMFAGSRETVEAQAVMVDPDSKSGSLKRTAMTIRPQDFVPSNSGYIYKILILAKRYLNGEAHLVI